MKPMSILGIVLILGGIIGLFVSRVSWTETKPLIKAGPIEINHQEDHSVWIPTAAGVISRDRRLRSGDGQPPQPYFLVGTAGHRGTSPMLLVFFNFASASRSALMARAARRSALRKCLTMSWPRA